jgi:hypothetical protein
LNITHYWLNKLIDFQFRAAALAKPTGWWWALYTVAPDEDGGGTECTGGSYARVPLAPTDTNWLGTHGTTTGNSSGTGAQTMNAVAVTFPTATADWGLVNGIALLDAATLGNMCYWTNLAFTPLPGASLIGAPFYVPSGDTPSFSANGLVLSFNYP